jgi:hypothetical protein
MLRISRILFDNKKYLMNLLEYQKMGINLEIYNTKCDIDKFLLLKETEKINHIQKRLAEGSLSYKDINDLIKDIHIITKLKKN